MSDHERPQSHWGYGCEKHESKNITILNYRRTPLVRKLANTLATLSALLLLTVETQAQCALDAFNPNPDGRVNVIIIQPDGKILIAGDFNTVAPNGGPPVARHNLARLNPDGTLDLAFDCDANCNVGGGGGEVLAMALQADGKVVLGGNFTTVGGQTRRFIGRVNGTTGVVDSFNPDAQDDVSALAVQADGKVLAGGSFLSIGGQPRNYLARLDGTTGAADSWDPNADGFVLAIVLQQDGKILAGGNFTNIGGQRRTLIARFDPTTGLADSFDPSPFGTGYVFVGSIALQGDGRILVGGQFTTIGGQVRRRIARLDPTTGLADSFNPNALGSVPHVYSIAVQPDGKILAGGFFTNIGGQPRTFIARLDGSTGLADSFNPHSSGVAVRALALRADGKILANGSFTSETGQSRNNLALLNPDCTPTPTPSTLRNISTRVRVLNGDNALIGGMIVTGFIFTRVIIRAIGPSLTGFGVLGALDDPTLELFRGSTLVAINDDWINSPDRSELETQGLTPSNNLESAIAYTMEPGQNYTAVVRGRNGGTGVGIVEAYDLQNQSVSGSRLGNISTRGFVDVDDNVMIAGMIAGPGNGASLKVLVRALGPTLSDFGVAGALANPTLDLVNSSGTVIRSNDNWKDDPQQRAAIEAAGLAPSHDSEAALVETVTPGAYTAVVRGSGRATGVGLVEAYNIP
jgi:uncharacterized delta-60 repeat protein